MSRACAAPQSVLGKLFNHLASSKILISSRLTTFFSSKKKLAFIAMQGGSIVFNYLTSFKLLNYSHAAPLMRVANYIDIK